MKKTLRLMATMFAAGAVIFWVVAGANCGWTRTQIPVRTVDAVTGLEGVQWQAKFVPGVDFLGAVLLGAGILAGISFFIPLKVKQPNIATKP